MPRKRLSEILHQVDPNLTIIEAGRRFKPTRGKTEEVYTVAPFPMTDRDWETAAGVVCSNCGREVFRSRDGLCMECWEKANEFEIRDRAGVLSFLPASVFMAIARPARKEIKPEV